MVTPPTMPPRRGSGRSIRASPPFSPAASRGAGYSNSGPAAAGTHEPCSTRVFRWTRPMVRPGSQPSPKRCSASPCAPCCSTNWRQSASMMASSPVPRCSMSRARSWATSLAGCAGLSRMAGSPGRASNPAPPRASTDWAASTTTSVPRTCWPAGELAGQRLRQAADRLGRHHRDCHDLDLGRSLPMRHRACAGRRFLRWERHVLRPELSGG